MVGREWDVGGDVDGDRPGPDDDGNGVVIVLDQGLFSNMLLYSFNIKP